MQPNRSIYTAVVPRPPGYAPRSLPCRCVEVAILLLLSAGYGKQICVKNC